MEDQATLQYLIWSTILLSILEVYRLHPSALASLGCYLNDCKQQGTFKGHSSPTRTITSLSLGPVLFEIFNIDLPVYLKTQVDIFSDDSI